MHTDAVNVEDLPLNTYLAKVIGICFNDFVYPYLKVKILIKNTLTHHLILYLTII